MIERPSRRRGRRSINGAARRRFFSGQLIAAERELQRSHFLERAALAKEIIQRRSPLFQMASLQGNVRRGRKVPIHQLDILFR